MDAEFEMNSTSPQTASRKERFCAWLRSPRVSVYVMKAMSSWGDRMWMFAVGLYLMRLSRNTLTLTAVYGLTGGVCVILLGALVGNWVDKNPRLKVARVSLVAQNSLVIVCAVLLCFVLSYHTRIRLLWPPHLENICSALVIATAVCSKLASIATKIAVEKDWVVVMCGGDREKLAVMNASMRRIDLLSNILAPALVGQIMTFASMVVGAVVIAAWNLFSVFIEYYLLWRIYKAVPSLAVKKTKDEPETKPAPSKVEEKPETEEQLMEDVELEEPKDSAAEETDRQTDKQTDRQTTPVKPKKSLFELVFGRFISIYKGWRVYMRQEVLPAGIAFSLEFMTVLAFDSITSGYAYSQRLSESVIGLLMAGGALTGIAGTFLFPVLRRRIGLENTGLVAFISFIGCLTLCVASVWADGSPFDLTFSRRNSMYIGSLNCSYPPEATNSSTPEGAVGTTQNNTHRVVKRGVSLLSTEFLDLGEHTHYILYSSLDSTSSFDSQETLFVDKSRLRRARDVGGVNTTGTPVTQAARNDCEVSPLSIYFSYTSIGLLMAGIVCARFGLWLSDLTITQVFQENVAETERGVVSGVQSSLNMMMDVIRYVMVLIAPHPETYGILVIISFVSICSSGGCFAYYVKKKQGYFFVPGCRCGKKGYDEAEVRKPALSVQDETPASNR